MKIKNFECPTTMSIGVIEEMKMRMNGTVKYKVLYRDYKGRDFSAWTTWVRDDGHSVGDNIPIKNVAIPSFGLLNVPVAVDNHPQRYVEPYMAAAIITGIASMFIGYCIGKHKCDK